MVSMKPKIAIVLFALITENYRSTSGKVKLIDLL